MELIRISVSTSTKPVFMVPLLDLQLTSTCALCHFTLSFFLRQDEYKDNNQAECIEISVKTNCILSNWQYSSKGFNLAIVYLPVCWRIFYVQMYVGTSLELSACVNMQFLIRSYHTSWTYPTYCIMLYKSSHSVAKWAWLNMSSNQCIIKQ